MITTMTQRMIAMTTEETNPAGKGQLSCLGTVVVGCECQSTSPRSRHFRPGSQTFPPESRDSAPGRCNSSVGRCKFSVGNRDSRVGSCNSTVRSRDSRLGSCQFPVGNHTSRAFQCDTLAQSRVPPRRSLQLETCWRQRTARCEPGDASSRVRFPACATAGVGG